MPWGAVAGAVIGVAGNALLGDHGAGDANSASADASRTSAQASKQQADIALDQWNTYKSTYQPLEKQLVGDAATYGTEADQEAAAGRAHADVSQAFDATGKNSAALLASSYGINPASDAFKSNLNTVGTSEAVADAGAMNSARLQNRELGYAKRLDAIGIGKGIPASSASSLSSVASTTGMRGLPNFNQSQQLNQQQAYGVYGIGQVAKNGVNAWFNNGSSTGPAVNQQSSGWTPEQAANYDGSGTNTDFAGFSEGTAQVRGPGTETSDSVPAKLSKNEAVLNAGAVRIIGKKAIEKLNKEGVAMMAKRGIMKRPPASIPGKFMAMQGA